MSWGPAGRRCLLLWWICPSVNGSGGVFQQCQSHLSAGHRVCVGLLCLSLCSSSSSSVLPAVVNYAHIWTSAAPPLISGSCVSPTEPWIFIRLWRCLLYTHLSFHPRLLFIFLVKCLLFTANDVDCHDKCEPVWNDKLWESVSRRPLFIALCKYILAFIWRFFFFPPMYKSNTAFI